MVLFLKFVLFYSMDVLPACNVCGPLAYLQKPKESISSTGTQVADGCEPLCGNQTLSSVEQSVLLTPGPSTSPASTLFLHLFLFVFGEVCRPGCLDLTPLLPLPPEGGGADVHYILAEVCAV